MCLFICLLVLVVVVPHEMNSSLRGNSFLGSALGVLGLYNVLGWLVFRCLSDYCNCTLEISQGGQQGTVVMLCDVYCRIVLYMYCIINYSLNRAAITFSQ